MFGMQKVFGLDVFPDSVFELEGKYYLNKMNEVCWNNCLYVCLQLLLVAKQQIVCTMKFFISHNPILHRSDTFISY